MLKKTVTIITLVCMVVLCASCSSLSTERSAVESHNSESVVAEYSEILLTFEEAITVSNSAAIAEFIAYEDTGEYIEYTFKTIEVLRGAISDEVIHMFAMSGTSEVEETGYVYKTGVNSYKAGEKYILLMEKTDMLFYNYPHYVLVTDLLMPLNDLNNSTMYGDKLPLTAGARNVENDIRKLIKEAPSPKDDRAVWNYSTSNDISVIVDESDIIFKVKVTGLLAEGIMHNGDTYYCDVLEFLKGESKVTLENRNDIAITVMKDSVQIGETYVVIVNKISDESAIFTQSSLYSIISSDDAVTIDRIIAAIKN